MATRERRVRSIYFCCDAELTPNIKDWYKVILAFLSSWILQMCNYYRFQNMLAHRRTPKFWLNLLTGSLMQSKLLASSKFKIHSIVKNTDINVHSQQWTVTLLWTLLYGHKRFPCLVHIWLKLIHFSHALISIDRFCDRRLKFFIRELPKKQIVLEQHWCVYTPYDLFRISVWGIRVQLLICNLFYLFFHCVIKESTSSHTSATSRKLWQIQTQ